MSYRENLLKQSEPLDASEISDLEQWLAIMECDCKSFGEAPEDTARINRIKARIAAERGRTS